VNNRKTDECFELRIVNTTFRLMQLGTSELTFAITPGHSGALAGSGFSVDVERGIQKASCLIRDGSAIRVKSNSLLFNFFTFSLVSAFLGQKKDARFP
jgi:hypothetical protein